MNVYFRVFIRALVIVFGLQAGAACTGSLSEEDRREKVCRAGGDAAYCDGGLSEEVALSDQDSFVGESDVNTFPDGSDQEVGVDTADFDIGQDHEVDGSVVQPDSDQELPDSDVSEDDISIEDADGLDMNIVDIPPEIIEGGDITLPDTVTLEVGDIPTEIIEDGDTIQIDTVTVEVVDVLPEIIEGGDITLPDMVTPENDGDGDSIISELGETFDTQNGSEVNVVLDIIAPKCLTTKGCEDGNACTDNFCDPAVGCVALPNSTTCTDSNACTEIDLCSEASCTSGKVMVCNDGNSCTADSCDMVLGCVFTNLSIPCEDSSVCTEKDMCANGICTSGSSKSCSDSNPCTLDTCDGVKGCSSSPAPDGTSCGGSLVCKLGTCATTDGMVLIPAGEFYMGCNPAVDKNCLEDEKPQHKVVLGSFYIDMLEVTVGQYENCMYQGKCPFPNDTNPACPMAPCVGGGCDPEPLAAHAKTAMRCAKWSHAEAYCKLAGKRLPTEAEWEMAARGGCEKYPGVNCAESMSLYPWGNKEATCDHGVFAQCDGVTKGGTKMSGKSPYGILDLAGNVQEWVADTYEKGYYSASPLNNPQGPGSAPIRVLRGGSHAQPSIMARASARNSEDGNTFSPTTGFRCAKTP